jgi:hypothetical protein
MVQFGRCGAMQKIGFTLIQQGSSVNGYYRCSYGNQICYNSTDNSGSIKDGRVIKDQLSMRVMRPGDGSSCIFNGTLAGEILSGNFICYQGGGILEEGIFEVERQF